MVLPLGLEAALDTVDRAAQTLQWRLGERGKQHVRYRLPMSPWSNPGRVEVNLYPVSVEATRVRLDGSISGWGPIQSNHLKTQLGKLEDEMAILTRQSSSDDRPAMETHRETTRESMPRERVTRDAQGPRIAALVIGLFVGIISFFQACAVGGFATLADQEKMQAEAGWGMIMAFLSILGAAFSVGQPRAATWFFGAGAVTGILAGFTADAFTDLVIWGAILAIPAILSFRAAKIS